MSSDPNSEEAHLFSGWRIAPAWKFTRSQSYPRLTADLEIETAIVGGGVAGLSTAMNCAAKTAGVALFEAGNIGEGSSSWSAGILCATTTVDLFVLEAAFGKEQASRVARFANEMLLRYSRWGKEVDWQTGPSYYVAPKRRHRSIIDSEVRARNHYKFPVSPLSNLQLGDLTRGFRSGIVAPQEHAVNPAKLLCHMASVAATNGCRIFEGTRVSGWKRVPGGFELAAGSHTVRARNLVLAVGISGSQLRQGELLNKLLVPVTGHILVTEPSKAVAEMVQQGGPIALWDTLKLYHYARYLADGRILIGGEEQAGFAKSTSLSTSDPAVLRLHAWAKSHHSIDVPPVQSAWRASLIVPADCMPLVHSQQTEGHFVSVITDGLPFGLALGESIAARLTGGDDWLLRLFCECRTLPLPVRMLKLLPGIPALHSLAHQIAFASLRVYDALA